MVESSIEWLPWNKDTFDKAKKADRPVLLAISASWCHWCHVMDETTYTDERVTRIINNRFVPIKIDNDRRPDLNRRYNMGGWPTVAVLTPKGELITGTTYEPPESLAGLLAESADFYAVNKTRLIKPSVKMSKKKLSKSATGSAKPVDLIIDTAAKEYDRVNGGFGDRPKFPFTDTLQLLLEIGYERNDQKLLDIATDTLDKMAKKAVFDPVGGGFFRYSTRSDWSEPHYEKMLEDNSKLLKLYLEAYQITGNAAFLATALHVFDYINNNFKSALGFFGSQNADESYYKTDAAKRGDLNAPKIDQTIYLDWNALTVSAYLLFSVIAESGEARNDAVNILDDLFNNCFFNQTGFSHFLDRGGRAAFGFLEDHALMIVAHLDAFEATGEERFFERAERIADFIVTELWDDERQAFVDRIESENLSDIVETLTPLNENSLAATALIRLGAMVGRDDLIAVAGKSLATFENSCRDHGLLGSTYALAVNSLNRPKIEISIIGDDVFTAPLLREVRIRFIPGRIIRTGKTAAAKTGTEVPGAYICVDRRCLKPVGSAKELAGAISDLK